MSTTYKWLIVIVAIIIVIAGIWYLGTKPTVPVATGPIKIGVILPLTGKLSAIGTQVKNGMDLAVEEINSGNGPKVQVAYEDSKMDPKEGVSSVQKLIDGGIKYLHVVGTPVILAVQPITEKNAVLMDAVSASPSSLILKNTNYTLRTFYSSDQAIDKLAELINQNKNNKVAVLFEKAEARQSQINELKKRNIKFVVEESYNTGEKDFRTSILKVKQAKPDLVLMLGYGADLPTIFKQMSELGIKSNQVIGASDFLEVPKDNLTLYEGVRFVAPTFSLVSTDVAKNFVATYRSKFGIEPDHQAAYAYDTVKILYGGITKTDGTTKNVMAQIKNIPSYEGVLGEINMVNGDMLGGLSFAQYKNGQFVPLAK